MNAFDKVYFRILTEESQYITTEADRTTKIIAKIGGGLLGI